MNHTLHRPELYPDGMTVGAYNDQSFTGNSTGGPPMNPVTTAVVSGGDAIFTGLTSGKAYRAGALVDGGWRWVTFTVAEASGDVATQDAIDEAAATLEAIRLANTKGVAKHGANAAFARPSGFASIEWIGSVSPANALDGDTWIDTST